VKGQQARVIASYMVHSGSSLCEFACFVPVKEALASIPMSMPKYLLMGGFMANWNIQSVNVRCSFCVLPGVMYKILMNPAKAMGLT